MPISFNQWAKLPGEFPRGDKIQAAMLLGFFVIWTLDTFFLRYSSFLNQTVPYSVRFILGTLVLLLSMAFVHQSEIELILRPSALNFPVITGIYHHSRHPMYLGALLFQFAFCFYSLSIASWVFMIGVCYGYNWLASFEERALCKVFASKYVDYCAVVPKWIPK